MSLGSIEAGRREPARAVWHWHKLLMSFRPRAAPFVYGQKEAHKRSGFLGQLARDRIVCSAVSSGALKQALGIIEVLRREPARAVKPWRTFLMSFRPRAASFVLRKQ